jgi:hypothetical protein
MRFVYAFTEDGIYHATPSHRSGARGHTRLRRRLCRTVHPGARGPPPGHVGRRRHARTDGIVSTATSMSDVLAVQHQLDSLQGHLEQLQGQLQGLDSQTTCATLAVGLTGTGARRSPPSSSGSEAPGTEQSVDSPPPSIELSGSQGRRHSCCSASHPGSSWAGSHGAGCKVEFSESNVDHARRAARRRLEPEQPTYPSGSVNTVTCWDCGKSVGEEDAVRSDVIRTAGILSGRAQRVTLCPSCAESSRGVRGWVARLLGRVRPRRQ